jgi:hypothetical protein
MKYLLLKSIILIQFVCLVCLSGCAQNYKSSAPDINTGGWIVIASASFPRSNLFSLVISDDTPFLATFGVDDKFNVAKYTDNKWQFLPTDGLSTEGMYDMFSFYVYKSTPYLAYIGDYSELRVLKFNGISWEALGLVGLPTTERAGLSGYHAVNININGADGEIYISLRPSYEDKNMYVFKYNNGSWESCVPDGTFGFSSYLAIHKGSAYALCSDTMNLFLKMNIWGETWDIIGNGPIPPVASLDPQFCFSRDNVYYICHDFGLEKSTTYLLKTSDYPSTSSSWETISTDIFTSESIEITSTYFNNYNDSLYFVGRDRKNGYKAIVLKYDGNNWKYIGAKGFSYYYATSPIIQCYQNTIYVAFREEYGITVMKYIETP